jgi:hypothetical protein
MERIKMQMKITCGERVSTTLLITSFLSVFFVFFLFARFLKFNETRSGILINDPILSTLGPTNHNVEIFLLTYGLVIFGLSWALRTRIGMLTTNISICFLIAFRAFTLFSVPLEPPMGIIPLEDMFLKNTFYNQQVLLKDLFFSGHTAAVFLLYFLIQKNWVKTVLLAGGLLLGFLLMKQHVHYSIDIFIAPFFSWLSYQGATLVKNFITEEETESLEMLEISND